MKDSNQNTVGELIKAYYDEHRGPGYLDEVKIIKGWSSVVGPFIAQYTKELHIKNGVLYARLSSDSLRTELSYSKTLLLKNLNGLTGREVITDLVLQ